MTNKPLACNIRQPIPVRVGDPKVDFHSGCCVIDVTFNAFYIEVGEIHFRNHYTAWLSVQVQLKEPGNADTDETNKGIKRELKWRTAVTHFQMMPNPHADSGAEDFFTISRSHMNFDLVNVSALRLILRQPSPVWKEFKIEDVSVCKNTMQAMQEVILPSWLNDENEDHGKEKVKGITSLSSLCSSLQQLWAQADQAESQQATATLGRYDVEGSYEINLLSYT